MNTIINEEYEIADKNGTILKGYIKISRNTNCLLFAHYCDSTLFYKKFFKISRDIFKVNKKVNKNLKEIKKIAKEHGYKKVWTKGLFSIYGDLRPLAVEAGFGKWSQRGIIENEKYGTDFFISAVFFR
ncbi:hypothetical protein JW813_05320 [Clostridium botulinum]|uniref:hypothetical protein n=1 Tax=Clostridium botulinum TaxID=1491 RepID=UPI0022465795|nr:hypothetical protein [Clostridium botulinum]UZP04429.1 hypothetical protein JW813_05320 [Clostridium botulinum]UZP07841.1 hypothetical protein JYA71_05595 [Clostridium botulinum]UZP11168.1 hypothetical protein JYA74_05315 [Clostridium botulinum]